MALAERVAEVLSTFIVCYYLSVLVVGRWWGPAGYIASGRTFIALPLRVVAGWYLVGITCLAVAIWAHAILEPSARASMLVGAGLLNFILIALAEGLLQKWRSARRAGQSNAT